MHRYHVIERILKEYKLNKARSVFIENQRKRFSGKGIEGSCVNETTGEYYINNKIDCSGTGIKSENELETLKYLTSLVEDTLDILDSVEGRYKAIIERYYIKSERMEDIAEDLHISRSKCYELCKEAVKCMTKIIYGEDAYPEVI